VYIYVNVIFCLWNSLKQLREEYEAQRHKIEEELKAKIPREKLWESTAHRRRGVPEAEARRGRSYIEFFSWLWGPRAIRKDTPDNPCM
jgi:predicted Holliday junction resolvase-like endonuclease